MSGRFDQAELLISLWKLGADEERLPTSHGILDRALEKCRANLPKTLAESLSFGITSVGLRCYELPDILLAAQEALLTTEPNPTYLASLVTLDQDSARQIVLAHGLSTAQEQELGRRLKCAVDEVSAEISVEPDQSAVA